MSSTLNSNRDESTPYEIKTVREIEIVLVFGRQFRQGSPAYERIGWLWHRCALSEALREGFPPGKEYLEEDSPALVAECRSWYAGYVEGKSTTESKERRP